MTIQGWSRSLNNGKIGAGTGAKIMEKVELELEPNYIILAQQHSKLVIIAGLFYFF